MTLNEAYIAQGGTHKVFIIPLKTKGYISTVTDDEERALVTYSEEGIFKSKEFFIEQLQLIDEISK